MFKHTARKWITVFAMLALVLSLSACSDLLSIFSPTPAATQTAPPVKTSLPTPSLTPSPNQTAAPQAITLWLPPQFDPSTGGPAAQMLQQRIDEFSRREKVTVEVRIKAPQGPGGLLDSLSAASAAAPNALPDLIALPRPDLETAALKGLLFAYPAGVQDDPDWFAYARELAQIQGTTFGLPLAGDALVLLYRPAAASSVPANWSEVFASPDAFIFPAADPQAFFTVDLYRAAGGSLQDDQRRPTLVHEPLLNVLTLYETGVKSGKLQSWLTQYESDNQAWQGFVEGRANWVVTWASRYLENPPADTALLPALPVTDQPFTSATGWVLALASPDENRRAQAAELAQYLAESEFMAAWTASAGVLPTRPSALAAWQDQSLQSQLSQISLAAAVSPPNDLLATLGPVLHDAVLAVMTGQRDASQAAGQALEKLGGQ